MQVQVRLDQTNKPFILDSGLSVSKNTAVLAQDGGRAVPLVFGTVLAYNPTTEKWVPLSNVAAVDGTAIPRAIYIGADILAADLVAGDVENVSIQKGGAVKVDKNQVVLENALTFDTIIGGAVLDKRSIENALNEVGIFLQDSLDITGFEN